MSIRWAAFLHPIRVRRALALWRLGEADAVRRCSERARGQGFTTEQIRNAMLMQQATPLQRAEAERRGWTHEGGSLLYWPFNFLPL